MCVAWVVRHVFLFCLIPPARSIARIFVQGTHSPILTCPPFILVLLLLCLAIRACHSGTRRPHFGNSCISLLYVKLEPGDTLSTEGRTLTKCASLPSAGLQERWKEMLVRGALGCRTEFFVCCQVSFEMVVVIAPLELLANSRELPEIRPTSCNWGYLYAITLLRTEST